MEELTKLSVAAGHLQKLGESDLYPEPTHNLDPQIPQTHGIT